MGVRGPAVVDRAWFPVVSRRACIGLFERQPMVEARGVALVGGVEALSDRVVAFDGPIRPQEVVCVFCYLWYLMRRAF